MEILIFIIIAIFAYIFGFYVYFNPEKMIAFQQKAYSYVNWRMEPISLAKEIRNTKLMGLSLVVVTLIICIYYCLR